MTVYLVDFENVRSAGLKGVENLSEDDKVVIFYSKNADAITFDVHMLLSKSKAEIETYMILRGGRNSLDFQLSTYLGYLVMENRYRNIVIISADKGFLCAINFWDENKELCNSSIRMSKSIEAFESNEPEDDLENDNPDERFIEKISVIPPKSSDDEVKETVKLNSAGTKEGNAKEANPREVNSKEAKPKEAIPREVNSKEAKPKEANPREVNSKEAKPKEAIPREVNSKEAKPKEVIPRETNPRETNLKEVKPKEVSSKETNSKEKATVNEQKQKNADKEQIIVELNRKRHEQVRVREKTSGIKKRNEQKNFIADTNVLWNSEEKQEQFIKESEKTAGQAAIDTHLYNGAEFQPKKKGVPQPQNPTSKNKIFAAEVKLNITDDVQEILGDKYGDKYVPMLVEAIGKSTGKQHLYRMLVSRLGQEVGKDIYMMIKGQYVNLKRK